jgi:hypothetical protein
VPQTRFRLTLHFRKEALLRRVGTSRVKELPRIFVASDERLTEAGEDHLVEAGAAAM